MCIQRDSVTAAEETKLNDGYACILFSLALTPNSSNELCKCCTPSRAQCAHTLHTNCTCTHWQNMGALLLFKYLYNSYRQFSEDFRKTNGLRR